MRRPFMESLDSDKDLDKSLTLAKTAPVRKALAAVRKAADVALNVDVPFRWWLLAAGAAALNPWEARYAGRLYVKLGRYQARRVLRGEAEARELGLLISALWEFLEAHDVPAEMLHWQVPEDWGVGSR